MRCWIFLGIVTVALIAPASLYAQIESVAQTDKPAPTKPAEKAAPCPPVEHREMPVTRSVLSQSFKPGESIVVHYNNQRERVGKLSEIQSDYFLLTTSKRTETIAYRDVDNIRKWSLGWRVRKTLLLPIKAPVYGVVYGGFYTLVGIGYFVDWITGHRLSKGN